jgi:hypothetical protein
MPERNIRFVGVFAGYYPLIQIYFFFGKDDVCPKFSIITTVFSKVFLNTIKNKGYRHILTTTISSRFIKKFFDNTPGGVSFYLLPRRRGDPQEAIGLNNPNKGRKSI